MSDCRETKEFRELNHELMELLEARDPRALEVIDRIRAMGVRRRDNAVKGYAFYRYAYYYYFTRRDLALFRKNVRQAIRYLLRSDDKEYLAGAYNLVAYDAQDMGCYDVAYAYFMIGVHTAEQKEGIALPGLIEASAGRLLIEMGEYRKGRARQKSAMRRMRRFPDMHTYHYNMILTYADIALASLLLEETGEATKALAELEKHYEASDREEKMLGKTHYLLGGIYSALIQRNDELMEEKVQELVKHWETFPWSDLYDFLFEMECMCNNMLAHDYISQVEQILTVTADLVKEEHLAIVLRYITLQVAYYEKVHDLKNLKACLRMQHAVQKRKDAEAAGMVRYAMEFSDIIEEIATMRKNAEEENLALQKQANTDALTGLPNRNAMNHYLQLKLEEAEENGTPFGIGIVDVDRFKQFNDTYGHQAGDDCLRKIGQVLLSFNENPHVFCARYGGDEFVVGYFGLSSAAIRKIDREMKARVMDIKYRAGKEPIEISQGICNRVPDREMKLWDYLTKADKKLFRIKRALPSKGRQSTRS